MILDPKNDIVRIERLNRALERLGVRRGTEIANRVQSRARSALARGDSVATGIQSALAPGVGLLQIVMVEAHVLGLRRSQILTKRSIDLSSKRRRASLRFLKRRLTITAEMMETIRATYAQEAAAVIERLGGRVTRGIQGTILQSAADGDSVRTGARKLSEQFEKLGIAPKHKASLETIFRTEVQTAFNAGAWSQYQDPDVQDAIWGYEYVTVGDDRVRPEHLGLDGVRLQKDDPLWDRIWPPNGYNSVPSFARVLTADGWRPIADVAHGDMVVTHRGRLRPVYELHRHEGPRELVTVEVDVPGIGPLWLTANHRVFTQRGWVDAGGLEVGDKVVYPSRVGGQISGRHVEDSAEAECFQNGPVPIQDGLRLVPLDFDAELQRWYVEVEPVRAASGIVPPFDSVSVEGLGEPGFACAQAYLGVGMMLGMFGVEGAFRGGHLAADVWPSRRRGRFQRSSGLAGAFGMESVCDDLGIVPVAYGDAVAVHQPSQGSERYSGSFRNVRQRASFGSIGGQESLESSRPGFVDSSNRAVEIGDGPSGLFSHSSSVVVGVATVKRIGRVPWGFRDVYNLAVRDDESYIAEGIAVHNCRCITIPILDKVKLKPPPDTFDVSVNGKKKTVRPGPDRGFAFNPGKLFSSPSA